jgi:RND family efflux transporter MFP subunit
MLRTTVFLCGWVVAGAATFVPIASAQNAVRSNGAERLTHERSAQDKPALDKQDIRAQLSPRRYTTLAAEVSAKIDRIESREGDSFKSGQVLIRLDCALQQAQQQRAHATATGAEKIFSANKRLAELNSIGQVELDTSEAEVIKARADVALMEATLKKCTIAAPFSGRVAEQKMREQQYVQAGQPILDILDDSALELEFIVPSRWLGWLKAGYGFEVQIDETGATYPAKITRLGARVDPVSQSVKAAALISGRFPELIAGMSGRVKLTPPGSPSAPR